MTDSASTHLRLSLPPDPRLLRVLRLVASGVASLGHLDLSAVEEVRVAVDELGSTLIGVSAGQPIELSFELTATALHVECTTALPSGTELEVDPLTDQILDVVATSHEWSTADGVARGRFEKTLAMTPSPGSADVPVVTGSSERSAQPDPSTSS